MVDPKTLILSILQPFQKELLEEIYARVSHIPMLAHYTSVEALESMLSTKSLWFSRSTDMKDISEVIEGYDMVQQAVEKLGPTIFKSIRYAGANTAAIFSMFRAKLINETYILSLSEHGSDRRTDRLTMWKEFGAAGRGICLVLRKDTLLGQKAGGMFPVHWAPIEYEDGSQLEQRVSKRLAQLEKAFASAPAAVRSLLDKAFGSLIFAGVIQIIASHKNSNYYDEQEVRFVRTELLNANEPPSDVVLKEVNTPKGQRTKFVLPMREYPEYGIDASISALLDHIIIGPSAAQTQIRDEVGILLAARGLSRVPLVLSTIPYRGDR